MSSLDLKDITGVAALLVHAAKIDEKYSDHEKNMIEDFIKSYLKNKNSKEILKKAEQLEMNSNQLLNFTNIIKKNNNDIKSDIIEHLWKIIISDNNIDQYESNLMRRLAGLLYVSDLECGKAKNRVLKKLIKENRKT